MGQELKMKVQLNLFTRTIYDNNPTYHDRVSL
jgi:hypothetical protein